MWGITLSPTPAELPPTPTSMTILPGNPIWKVGGGTAYYSLLSHHNLQVMTEDSRKRTRGPETFLAYSCSDQITTSECRWSF